MSVDEIEKAIVKLSPEERAMLRAWWDELYEAEWDRQIEEDAKSGKLDKLFEGAMADIKAGRVKEI